MRLIQKKILINGKEYESLEDVPTDLRGSLANALESGPPTTLKIVVNGQTYANLQEVPAPLRVAVGGLVSLALKGGGRTVSQLGEDPGALPHPALRPESVFSMKAILISLGVTALLAWLYFKI